MRNFIVFVSLLIFSSQIFAEQSLTHENKVKAAYLFNFIKFISWKKHTQQPLVFCFQSDPEFQDFFSKMVLNSPKSNKAAIVHTVNMTETSACDLAYVTSDNYLNKKIMEHTVIIKDTDYPVNTAAVFTLFKRQNKLRFEVDAKEAERVNILISSELLKLAKRR